jgi:general stress protein YciG
MVKTKSNYASEFARKGGKARAKKLTKKQRQEIARLGGLEKAAKQKKAKK